MSGASTLVVRDDGILGAGIKTMKITKLQKKNDSSTILIRTVTSISALLRSTS